MRRRGFLRRTSTPVEGGRAKLAHHYIVTPAVLGSGSYAVVKLGQDRRTGKNVAIKIIDKTKLKNKEMKKLYKEVDILKKLHHKNVVRYYASYDEGDTFYIVMEYVLGGDLCSTIVDDNILYNESDIRGIVRSILIALHYCKEQGIIHRDMKPDNVLLSAEGEIKLVDFNLSYQLDPTQTEFSVLQTMLGTPNYVAPEVISGKPYSYKCDIWSTGVICFFLLSGGHLPFNVDLSVTGEERRKNQLLQQVKRGVWSFSPPEAWESISDDAKDFLKKAMHKDPERRFNYDQLLNHAWLYEGEAPGVDDNVEDEEEEDIINKAELSRYNTKRKLLSVKNVKQAINAFESLMKSEEFLQIAPAESSYLGSGLDAFKGMLD